MNKKILIGSMLVLVMLLLMPSIPAIQQKTIEEGFKQDLQEKSDEINLNDLEDIKDLPKHPILFYLVYYSYLIRFTHGVILFFFSLETSEDGWPTGEFEHPLIGLRGLWLSATAMYWVFLWEFVSDKLGWNWEIPWS